MSQEFPDLAFTTITTEEFASKVTLFARQFRKYERVVFYTYDLEMSRTILWHGIVWWLGRQGFMLDGSGRKRHASLAQLIVRDSPQLLLEPALLPYVFSRVMRDLSFLESKEKARL
ncbi:MAG TPA: hypothetical protein VKY31_14700, partial [Terriglobia bacterium]|nr:hypothetical protein [Terriglobia bacterium]